MRDLLHLAVELGSRRLIKTRLFCQAKQPDGFEQTQCADRVGIRGIFRGLEAHLDMRLCGEIVDLVRLHFLDDADEVGGVGHVAIMQRQPYVLLMRILVEIIDATGVERRGTPLDAVDVIALCQEEVPPDRRHPDR